MSTAAQERQAGGRPGSQGAPGRAGRLLLLEDDPKLRRAFAGRLRAEGHQVDEVRTLRAARRAMSSSRYDCLVLDRLVPDGDAIELVAELQDVPDRAPVVVLSALGDQCERIEGLRAGADDYVPKPVYLDELALRVANATATPAEPGGAGGPVPLLGPICIGDVAIDRCARRVTVGGEEVHLTRLQYVLLEYLAVRRYEVVLVEQLLEHCWDERRPLFTNPLATHVTRLRGIFRGRLEIQAVRGGYRLQAASAKSA